LRNSKRGKRKAKDLLVLPPDLERGVLHGMMTGVVETDVVEEDELSREGQMVYKAILALEGTPPPYTQKAVLSAAVDVLGLHQAEVKKILGEVVKEKIGAEGKTLVNALRDKQALTALVNEASAQLAEGRVDEQALLATLEGAKRSEMKPACEYLADGIPDDPTGVIIPDLPQIMKATGGVFGMWALGGEPGAGKSTLGLKITRAYAEAGKPVLYYDFENGINVMLNHLGHAVGKDLDALKRITERIYFRDTIKTLYQDLSAVGAKCLVVVDSIQKLPTTVEYRRVGLDRWIVRFEALKKQGHDVLLLSEKNRGSYGDAKQSGFKETSEIEYAADLGAQLIEIDEGVIEFHIVKNRHRQKKGLISTLVWNNWSYEEETGVCGPKEQRAENQWQD
jgi:hypothetical protein